MQVQSISKVTESAKETVVPIVQTGTKAHQAPVLGGLTSRRLFTLAKSVAETPSTVLLTGESGAGKEVVARFIHDHSGNSGRSLEAINCAALSPSLIESELFGHERGAFSGALQRHKGVFERANGGTLLLDEVSEIPPEMQAKLLRVLQERSLHRVGGAETVRLDVRVIATTNRDLRQCVKEGTFRLDLYYRLNVFPLRVPSLRERPEDIEILTRTFLGRLVNQMNWPVAGITEAALRALQLYEFPGNVRELLNILERAVILAGRGGVIDEEHIVLETNTMVLPCTREDIPVPTIGQQPTHLPPTEGTIAIEPGTESLSEIQQRIILATLDKFNGNRTRTAESLGVSLRTIRNRLRDYREQGIVIVPPA